ncbi:hypothetical protein N2152v2_007695 [Parachlorella kessleri]
MGAFTRFKETMKQKTLLSHCVDGKFMPTPNQRNTVMLKEAADFQVQLSRMDKELRSMQASVESLLNVTRAVAAAPLPHVYEETAAGAGGAVKPPESIGGPRFRADAVSQVAIELSRRMEAEVLGPLERWKLAHEHLLTKFSEGERLRLDLDGRRRQVAELAGRAQALQAKGAGGQKGAEKAQAQLEAAMAKLHQKEEKMTCEEGGWDATAAIDSDDDAVASEAHTQAEADLHRQLTALIKDAAYLRNFMATGLAVQGSALTDASAAMGVTPAGGSPKAARVAAGASGGSPVVKGPATPLPIVPLS